MKVNEYYTMQQIEKIFCFGTSTRLKIFSFERFNKLLITVKRPRAGAYGQISLHPVKVLPRKNIQTFKRVLKYFQNGRYYTESSIA